MRCFTIVLALLAVGASPPAEAGGFSDRIWVGGGIGLGFGDVEYYSIRPLVGFQLSERFSTGIELNYSYRRDERFDPTLKSEDYGVGVFARYRIVRNFFLQGEFEYLSSEFSSGGQKDREDFESVLAGAGYQQPINARSSVYVLALYNFDFNDDFAFPYDDPWVIRVGVTFSF